MIVRGRSDRGFELFYNKLTVLAYSPVIIQVTGIFVCCAFLRNFYLALLTLPSYNEQELLTLIADGDEAAFKQLYDRYLPLLLPFLQKLTRTRHAADEVIQETFIRLWLSRDKLAEVHPVRPWIFEVAAHAAYTWLRKNIRYQQVLGDMVHTTQPSEAMQPVQDHLHLVEARQLIHEAIDLLPDQRRKIYRLSREQGMTIPEIADALNLSPNTVKNTLVTALAFIRDHLHKAGYQLPLFLLLLLK